MHKQPFVTPYTLNLVLTGSDFPHSPSSKIIVLNCVMFIATYNYLPTLYDGHTPKKHFYTVTPMHG